MSEIVVAGHICLDLIPGIEARRANIAELFRPGTLVNAGPAVISTGGCVANTGLALHKLGERVRLVGKVGDDPFGHVVLGALGRNGVLLTENMVVDSGVGTSYTVVISPPGIDRVFLHHPGANDTFTSDDVTEAHLKGAGIFHFGYPPIMRAMFSNGGVELEKLMRRAKEAGLVTALDLSMPDPESESGKLDWVSLLRRVLPYVDIVLPSLDEIAFMLKHQARVESDNLRHIADWLIRHGCAMVVLKLGDRGLYLRTSNEAARFGCFASAGVDPANWINRELVSPCWIANVVGTTGSGDCTVAGFLSSFARNRPAAETMLFATAVGACSVEAPDATGGIVRREEVERRMAEGWKRHALAPTLKDIQQATPAN